MLEALLQFSFSAIEIVIAGIFLAKSSDAIGELTKLGRLFAGSILDVVLDRRELGAFS